MSREASRQTNARDVAADGSAAKQSYAMEVAAGDAAGSEDTDAAVMWTTVSAGINR